MNEIEKMYENANVETLSYCCDGTHGEPTKRCKGCPDYREIYPQITAEKQLKILCFIVNNKHSVTFHDQVFGGDKLTLKKIQEDLAWAVNKIWQDLTPEEKQQIKEILE